jgi:hypothetical protein
VFTARYALSPHIKQIRVVFKGLIMFHFFNAKYWGPFYSGNWVKRPLCKVSENPKFQVNKIFKERIKNSATFLNNPCNYCCLVYVTKSKWTPVTWWFALGGHFTHNSRNSEDSNFIHVPQICNTHIPEKYISLFLRVPIFLVLILSLFSKYRNSATINPSVVTFHHDAHTGHKDNKRLGMPVTCAHRMHSLLDHCVFSFLHQSSVTAGCGPQPNLLCALKLPVGFWTLRNLGPETVLQQK